MTGAALIFVAGLHRSGTSLLARCLAEHPAIAEVQAMEPLAEAVAGSATRHGPGVALSPRERDVLRLLVLGQTDREIAETLYLSVRTVERHVARILAKLDVRTRTAAAATAIAAGLVSPNPPGPA